MLNSYIYIKPNEKFSKVFSLIIITIKCKLLRRYRNLNIRGKLAPSYSYSYIDVKLN